MATLIECGSRRTTRARLQANASRGAAALASLGVRWGDCVAIMLHNDFLWLEVMLACEQLGACAVAINAGYQANELAYVLQDSRAGVLIIHDDLYSRVRDALTPGLSVILVPAPSPMPANRQTEALQQQGSRQTSQTSHDKKRGRGGDEDAARRVECWPALIARHDDLPKEAPDSPGTMIYTSGTTGYPKGVRRQPADRATRMRMDRSRADIHASRPGMRTLMACPLHHAGPNATIRAELAKARHIHIMPRFEAQKLLEIIERRRITHVHVVPEMFIRLLELPAQIARRYDVSSLEQVSHVGSPCPDDVKRRMIEWFGPVVVDTYGSTETALVTRCTSAQWLARPGTVGRPVQGVSIRILDDDGRILEAGQTGEIHIRNDNVPPFEYFNQPRATQQAIVDGHVSVGDMGYLDSDGYLFVTGRKRDMVISGGINLYPAEIERVLDALAGVRESAVFGLPDGRFGEMLCAIVVAQPGHALTIEAVRRFLSTQLARHKIPRKIVIHDKALPRDVMGKLRKDSLPTMIMDAQ